MSISYLPLKEEDYCLLDKSGSDSKAKYIGCIGVKKSMRSLDHRTRSEVAKESIIRLCEANKMDRKIDKKRLDSISCLLNDEPILKHSGTDVQICVTPTHLNVISLDNEQIIIQHEMPNVSFASSGYEDTVDFVAYVAKNDEFRRACFVLECRHETAQKLFDIIKRGFEIRTKQILHNNLTLSKNKDSVLLHERFPSFNGSTMHSINSHNGLTATSESSYRIGNADQRNENVIALTRTSLEKEPWFHGSYLSREESENRLKQDGDFLVRESMLDPGHFVLSVMRNGEKLHLLFDSMSQVRTKEMVFNNISHLVKYHHEGDQPIVSDNRIIYLRNGVRPRG